MDYGLLTIALLIVGILLGGYGYKRSLKFSEQIFKDIRTVGLLMIAGSLALSFGQMKDLL